MYCRECGNKLLNTDKFCSICGERIQIDVNAPVKTTNDNGSDIVENDDSTSVLDLGEALTTVLTANNTEATSLLVNPNLCTDVLQNRREVMFVSNGVNKEKKKRIILPVMLFILLVAIIVVVILHLPGNRLSPQRKVIDAYFDAINDSNQDAIIEMSYHEDAIEIKNNYNVDEMLFFTSPYFMGFSRGLYEYDMFKVEKCVADSYPNKQAGLTEDQIRSKTLNMLDVSYEVLDIKPFEEFELYKRTISDDNESFSYEDVNKYINCINYETGDQTDFEAEEVYVAQVKVEWKYDDMLYGMNKKWWKDEGFIKLANSNENFTTYKNSISFMKTLDGEDKVYILILYKCEGEWYIMLGDRLVYLSSPYEDGEATISLN